MKNKISLPLFAWIVLVIYAYALVPLFFLPFLFFDPTPLYEFYTSLLGMEDNIVINLFLLISIFLLALGLVRGIKISLIFSIILFMVVGIVSLATESFWLLVVVVIVITCDVFCLFHPYFNQQK